MTKSEAIKRMCKLKRSVQHFIGYDIAASCFCEESCTAPYLDYQNDGRVAKFIEDAVAEKIQRMAE